MIEPEHGELSIVHQCELLGISRSGWYLRAGRADAENLHYMRLIDEQYLHTPFYSSRRMTAWLRSGDTRSIANGCGG